MSRIKKLMLQKLLRLDYLLGKYYPTHKIINYLVTKCSFRHKLFYASNQKYSFFKVAKLKLQSKYMLWKPISLQEICNSLITKSQIMPTNIKVKKTTPVYVRF